MNKVGKLTLVRHYNCSLYEDGVLCGTVLQRFTAESFCHCLEIPLEVIYVGTDDMMREERTNQIHVPEDLEVLTEHLKVKEKEKKKQRLESLQYELAQLEKEMQEMENGE